MVTSVDINTSAWQAALETGAVVQLTHERSGLSFRALVERSGSPTLSLNFCSLERPYEKLRVALNGSVSWALAAAKFATFLVEQDAVTTKTSASPAASATPEALVHLRSLANQKKPSRDGSLGWYLGVPPVATATTPQLAGDVSKGDDSRFRLTLLSTQAAFALDPIRSIMADHSSCNALSESQRLSFMHNGYLQIRGAVPLPLVNAALRRINHDLGLPGRMVDGGVEGSAKLAGDTSNSAEILQLFQLSDVAKYVEALVGHNCVEPPRGAQIALRFPELGPPREPRGSEWHTDGMRQGRRHPFTLLAGVALSNVAEPLSGNLTVFPESHRLLQPLLTPDGRLRGHADECYKAESVWGDGTLPDLGTPVQLLAARGDLVLAHPDLAHRGGLNFSPDVRYQVYFRIKHRRWSELQDRASHDLYADLEGLQSTFT